MIELLVVVLLIALLSALYWGGLGGKAKQSQLAACQQNLQKLYISLQIYANDHSNSFPVVPSATSSEQALDPLVPRYTSDTSLFICPASGDPALPSGESLARRHISYAYYMGRSPGDSQTVVMSDAQVNALPKSPGQQIFSGDGKPPGNNHKKSGGNFLFCDGHADSTVSGNGFSLALPQGVVFLNPSPK